MKFIDSKYVGFNIPTMLEESIENVVMGRENQDSLLDCYEMDVYGLVNMFYNSNALTKEQANIIRRLYT